MSVVIPVRDRARLLADLLDALDDQSHRSFEVIVVDDGSVDGSAEVAAARTVAGRPVRVLRAEGKGAVHARQLGAAAATGDVLAFTDSDCRPSPQWLAAIAAAVDSGAALVHGPTVPARPLRPLERSIDSGHEGLFPTCNVAYRRAAFEEAGGFDGAAARRLGFRVNRRAKGLGFGEDTLLAWSLVRSGHEVRFVDDAIVEHHVFPADFRDWVSRCWMAAAFPALLREVPEIESTLVRRRVLFGPRSRLPVYATVLALLSRRPALIGSAAVWWTATRARDLQATPASRSERARALPAEMALDVVTAAALIVGSIRARRVTL